MQQVALSLYPFHHFINLITLSLYQIMKPTFCFLLLFCLANTLSAQQTDYDAIVQPLDAKARELPEYLVQLAWLNSPDGAIAMEEVKNAQDAAKNVRKEWTRDVQATFNLNEANLRSKKSKNDSLDNNLFFPRYNFGVSLNLYNVLSQKNKSQISKREVAMAALRVNQRKLAVRAETLTRYANFKLAKEVYKTRALAEQEMNTNFVLMEQSFKTDEATFEQYTLASTSYYQAQESRIRAEAEVQLTKFQLEAILGLKWEQVQHPAKDE